MPRPPKLSRREWEEIGRRYAAGESARALARIYPVSESGIRKRFGAQCAEIREAASALAIAESRIERMPVSAQGVVRSLADRLKGIQDNLLEASHAGARTTAIMHQLALKQAEKLARQFPTGELDPDDMRPMVAAIEAGNRASSLSAQIVARASQDVKSPSDALTPAQLRRMLELQEEADG